MRSLFGLLAILTFTFTGVTVAVDITAGMLKVQNGEIYYETAGKGKAIVWIHGGYGDRRMWDDQFQEFAKNYRVVRYDHRGFGKSSDPKASYSPVSDLIALLNHLKIEKAYLIGNSLGGTLALDFGLLHPGRVSGIVVVASGASGHPVPEEDEKSMTAAFEAGKKKDFSVWLSNPMVSETKKFPAVRKKVVEMVEQNARIFNMEFWPAEKMDPPAAQRLHEIKLPVLVIAGEKDAPFVNVMAKHVVDKVRGAKIVFISGTDHMPQMEKPVEFNTIVRSFLQQPHE